MSTYRELQTDYAMNGMRVFRELLTEAATELPGGEDETLTIRQILGLIDAAFASVGASPE